MAVKEFDLTTHIRDVKTGQIVRDNTYRLFRSKNFGTIYERPKGSGICYYADGSRAPTIEQVRKINEAAEKSAPKPLTTADLDTIREDAKREYADQIEAAVKAKAEVELAEKVNDLVAERMSVVLGKLGITGQDAEKAKEMAAPVITVTEPEAPSEPEGWSPSNEGEEA